MNKMPDGTCGAARHTRKWWKTHGIGTMRKGDLSSRGYSVAKGKTARHRALRKTVKALGPLSTFHKLNAVAVLTKRSSKGKSKTFKADRNWVKKTFMKSPK